LTFYDKQSQSKYFVNKVYYLFYQTEKEYQSSINDSYEKQISVDAKIILERLAFFLCWITGTG